MRLHIKQSDREALSEEEQEIVGDIDYLLSSSLIYIQDFKAALDLYTMLEARGSQLQADLDEFYKSARRDKEAVKQFRQLSKRVVQNQKFMNVCQRDAIMTLRHIDWLLIRTLRERVRKVAFLSSRVPGDTLQAALDIFQKAFPDVEHLRNAVGHSAEENRTRQKRDKQRGDVGPLVINGYGHEFTTTWNGKTYKFSLNENAYDALSATYIAVQKALVLYPGEWFYENLANQSIEF